MQYLDNILEITYVDLNMGVNQYLIVASHNIKMKKFSSIAIPLFDLPYSCWVIQYCHGRNKVKFEG
jgi:hypothetical protein